MIENFTSQLGTIAYAWGGLIPDIYNDKILREHDDVEHLVLNIYDYIPKLQEMFTSEGWNTEILENGDLRVKKDGAKLHLGHLEVSDKARWYHNGKKGVIVFPESWLNPNPIQFQGMKIHAVYPEFQYALKTNPSLMNPGWQPRQKDKDDTKRLEELLVKRNIRKDTLASQIESIILNN
ncbi:hypothetical protein GF389_02020 [Candidatus Dojkabacteria bacterium]|nr:hypothetical protein [Candidatus Dojkabacteria bacterium]